ncbi:zf-TFIIB domain-containing protein [Pseudooceanicola sp.]|uniref:TFIIB-type zinc ribbon-containing protein n=1 Tax=Pseudooceanicola sp. TaxID=1914328 RepID=UPI0035C69A2C
MKCPVDGADLMMTARQGVEIDYCPKCRGVWLDRGELDKIIDRQNAETASVPRQNRPVREPARDSYYEEPRYREEGRRKYQDGGYYKRPKYKKRKSILSEIFDFD